MQGIRGKLALVTGGSRGIGAATCRLLGELGARVAVHCHLAEGEAEAVAEGVRQAGSEAFVLRADLRDAEETVTLFRRIASEAGDLDFLVNNAGVWREEPLEGLPDEALQDTLEVNLKAVFRCCREAAAPLGRRGGAIVSVASTAGVRGESRHSPYAASKGGLLALTRSLAEELAPEVRVNAVAPGWVVTDMSREALADPERNARILEEIPLRRIALPEDVAGPIVFLLSDLARHITGTTVHVNGGSVRCG
jgi:NAD(P)-dependent dehydrogenase (short-subunit alcohol dehydrogenase family)